MFKRIIIFFTVVFIAVILTGCPGVLISGLPSDLMISLGVFRSAEGVASLNSALGGQIYVPVLINDLSGRVAAGSYDVTFTLDTDGDLATIGDNIAVGTAPVTAGTETVLTLDVPATAVAATYNLYASFEAAAGDPATIVGTALLNIGVVPLVVGATNEADLEIQFVNPPSAVRLPGGTFPLSFKVINTGNKLLATGTAILVRFEIPINAVDTEFGTTTITLAEDLYPNDFVTGTASITMPSLTQIAADLAVAEADVDAWNDTITGTVDPDNSIVEIVEGDTDTFNVDSGTLKPDLRVDSIDVPDYAVVGGDIEVAVTIRNDGYAPASAGSYGLILFYDVNTNGVYDAGTDTILRTWADADSIAVPWDPDGGTYNRIVYTTTADDALIYPAAMTAGDHTLCAIITGSLDEWSSTNNTGTAGLHMIDKNVDLTVGLISSTIAAAIDEGAGGTVPVTVSLINNGTDSLTTDFSVEFYASSNGGLNPPGDISLGTLAVIDDITAGAQISVSGDVNFPASQGAGFYTVYAVADSAGNVSETDESNNYNSSVAQSSVFLVVDDGGSDLDVNVLLCFPDGAAAVSFTQYVNFYDAISPWDTITDNDNYSNNDAGPGVLGALGITLTQGQDHGLHFYADSSNIAVSWRLVPLYVTDINTAYIPNALTTDDAYEDNDTTGTATQLTGAALPFISWVNSYDSSSYDNDYYYFNF